MKNQIKALARFLDLKLARFYPSSSGEVESLIVVFFHSLLLRRDEAAPGGIDPSLAVTVDQFRRCIEDFAEHGYRFVSPADVDEGRGEGKQVMITFDDGYFNNHHAVPLAREYRMPVTIFLSTGHITGGKCFWWDVVYRERTGRGASRRKIAREMSRLAKWRSGDIDRYLAETFGHDALRPRSDIDRPFTPDELRDLSREPYLHWGNHTVHHENLFVCSREEALREMEGANRDIAAWTGKTPVSIAYPGGANSAAARSAAEQAGLRLGFTTRPAKNRFPIFPDKRMILRRFPVQGHRDIAGQCDLIRSNIRPFTGALGMLKRWEEGS